MGCIGGDRLGKVGNSNKEPATPYPAGRRSSGQSHSHLGLGRCRPDGGTLRHHQEHAFGPTLPVFLDGPGHPDERYPSFQTRCHALADILLPAPLDVMFGPHDRIGLEQLGYMPVDGQSSEIAAIPKLPRHRCRPAVLRASMPRIPEVDCTDDPTLVPTKEHSRQPVGAGDCVPSPTNSVSTQLRNRTRARPCSRYPLSPWHGPGNSTFRLVHRCGYTRPL